MNLNMSTGNMYADNVLYNMVGLAPFILGIYFNIDGLLTLGVMIFWAISILGSLMMFMPREAWVEIFTKDYNLYLKSIKKARNPDYIRFNILYDLSITFILAYFDYGVLAFFYAVHIIGYFNMFKAMDKAGLDYERILEEEAVRVADEAEDDAA